MRRRRVPTIRVLARLPDPFDQLELLLERLQSERSESRFVEWKSCPPLGPSVDKGTRLRMAKAAFSFANTEGGFIVFGVNRQGQWTGLQESELAPVDPAQLSELFDSYVAPEIQFSYRRAEAVGRGFSILHVPPSPNVPHVATKDGIVEARGGKADRVIAKHAVYVRYGARSDLASRSHYERMISQRTERLKSELLRTIKKIPVSVPTSLEGGKRSVGAGGLDVTRMTDDPEAPLVRLTRDPSEASGIILLEKLPERFLDDVNNVVGLSNLIARGKPSFTLGREMYYRVYAQRDKVDDQEDSHPMLAGAALHELYAPCLFWLLLLNDKQVADLLRDVLASGAQPQIRAALRFAVLLGEDVRSWVHRQLAQWWKEVSQPPGYVHWFSDLHRQAGDEDVRLLALKVTRNTQLTVPAGGKAHRIGDLLGSAAAAADLLSSACADLSAGGATDTSTCRALDIIAYGQDFGGRATRIGRRLTGRPVPWPRRTT